MTYHAFRQRGAYGNRIPGLIDPKALGAFDPTYVSGCKLWIDFSDPTTLYTDAGSTPVSSDGDAIYQVNDKSGNGFNATQIDLAKRALYKTNIKNGLDSALFDGSNDCFNLPALGFSGDVPISIFAVINADVVAHRMIFTFGQQLNLKICALRTNSGTDGYYFFFYGDDLYASGTVAGWRLINGIYDSINSTRKILMNGTLLGSDSPGNPNFNNVNYKIGAYINDTYTFGKYYGELVVYDEAVSDTDRQLIEAYFNNKWDLY